jgi:penicillin-binding protein 2
MDKNITYKILTFLFGDEFESKTNHANKYSWVEQTVLFDVQQGKQVVVPHSDQFVGSSFTQKKALYGFFALVLFFSILIGRVVYMQIIEGDTYLNRAERNRQRIIPIPAERGIIYDRNGVQLTENIPNFSLAVTPQDLSADKEEREVVVAKIADLTGEKAEIIADLLDEYGSYSYESIIILEDLEYEAALQLQIASADLPGIHIVRGSKRLYTEPERLDILSAKTSSTISLAHTLGYLGKLNREELDTLYDEGYLPSDSIGKTGVEQSYEKELRGIYGRRKKEVDAFGKYRITIAEQPPIPGNHVVLSIDIAMQQELQRIMQKYMTKAGKTRGSAIAVQPDTGEILALVSIPTFDNNEFSGGISQKIYDKYISDPDEPLFHRAIGGTYPSGSVIKPAIASAALEEGIITGKTTFLSNGGIRIGQWFFPDWRSGGHGITNVRHSLAQSVNTFYYIIGGGHNDFEGLGIDRIVEYLKKFGLTKKLDIDILGEASGFLPSKQWKEEKKQERWYIGDTYNVSIGQGDVLVTPLQIAMMTASVANNGTLYTPHVVQKLIDPLTKESTPIETQAIRSDFINPVHLSTVRAGMRDCVTYGSCLRLSLLPFPAAGKTGTAQWNSNREPHAWFTSFAPYEQPEIVLTILVEEGEGGSKIGAPIAYEFYEWWGRYK